MDESALPSYTDRYEMSKKKKRRASKATSTPNELDELTSNVQRKEKKETKEGGKFPPHQTPFSLEVIQLNSICWMKEKKAQRLFPP